MMSDFAFSGLLLAAFLVVVFLSYRLLSFSEERYGSRVTGPRKMAGIFATLLGLTMVSFWSYFAITERGSLFSGASGGGEATVHFVLELMSGVTPTIAGLAMLFSWSRAPIFLMGSIGLLIFTTMMSLSVYYSSESPSMWTGVGVVMAVLFTYFIGLVYGWEHFVLKLNDREALPEGGDRIPGSPNPPVVTGGVTPGLTGASGKRNKDHHKIEKKTA